MLCEFSLNKTKKKVKKNKIKSSVWDMVNVGCLLDADENVGQGAGDTS